MSSIFNKIFVLNPFCSCYSSVTFPLALHIIFFRVWRFRYPLPFSNDLTNKHVSLLLPSALHSWYLPSSFSLFFIPHCKECLMLDKPKPVYSFYQFSIWFSLRDLLEIVAFNVSIFLEESFKHCLNRDLLFVWQPSTVLEDCWIKNLVLKLLYFRWADEDD